MSEHLFSSEGGKKAFKESVEKFEDTEKKLEELLENVKKLPTYIANENPIDKNNELQKEKNDLIEKKKKLQPIVVTGGQVMMHRFGQSDVIKKSLTQNKQKNELTNEIAAKEIEIKQAEKEVQVYQNFQLLKNQRSKDLDAVVQEILKELKIDGLRKEQKQRDELNEMLKFWEAKKVKEKASEGNMPESKKKKEKTSSPWETIVSKGSKMLEKYKHDAFIKSVPPIETYDSNKPYKNELTDADKQRKRNLVQFVPDSVHDSAMLTWVNENELVTLLFPIIVMLIAIFSFKKILWFFCSRENAEEQEEEEVIYLEEN